MVVMTWQDIEYSVLVKDPKASKIFRPVMKKKQILSPMSGSAESGQLLAIMGPTGALAKEFSLLPFVPSQVNDDN